MSQQDTIKDIRLHLARSMRNEIAECTVALLSSSQGIALKGGEGEPHFLGLDLKQWVPIAWGKDNEEDDSEVLFEPAEPTDGDESWVNGEIPEGTRYVVLTGTPEMLRLFKYLAEGVVPGRPEFAELFDNVLKAISDTKAAMAKLMTKEAEDAGASPSSDDSAAEEEQA